MARETHNVKRFQRRERTPPTRDVPAIVVTMASARECTFVVVFGSLLFCSREHCADLCIVIVVVVVIIVIVIVVFEEIGLYMGKFM